MHPHIHTIDERDPMTSITQLMTSITHHVTFPCTFPRMHWEKESINRADFEKASREEKNKDLITSV